MLTQKNGLVKAGKIAGMHTAHLWSSYGVLLYDRMIPNNTIYDLYNAVM